ncbi:biotin carboxylase N-terminal domain-containing protein [Nocardiopsis composta]|uniref:Biotin-dependent 3-methylcrotonyl-coenzyme A carboxylase alpha1 subunit n=3 Tax=Nocardiopsis composta TaxID=157465 RepID=A0A7W8VH08_9ACTN|nr:biotin carboxylase N-terminal domain-containing protein [Nocardiopsis composta]MBB5435534.1 acetyl-CoA/propionyl-CoA carboxylase biotin carboxyl carrier protein [Nocardiopsis composta]
MTTTGPRGQAPACRTGEPPAVLVANRGEIAVRIIRTLRRLGMRSVAVHGDGDAGARHVREADTAVRLGGAALADSYLNGPAIVEAARASGASMVHPGYGFLSENAEFARLCTAAGLVFVGPPPEAIEAMGDKIRAKAAVAAAGVPLLPGFAEEPGAPLDDGELAAAAEKAGYPLLIKPSAGGGGKGMRLVRSAEELAGAAAAARREARAAFGDATLLVERYVERPRHIEVQVLADGHGTVLHLGERECSLQRRHQKIVEEAPSPLVDPALRAAMGEAAVAAAKACGYVGAGTVEFIVQGGPGGAAPEYAFLEMNTRLQVEHPVTEEAVAIRGRRGIDLVELQLRVALGEPLPFGQADVELTGHAVECRIYAEDPARDFLPTGGTVLRLDEPAGEHVRVDSGLDEGTEVTSAYDPMLAKVVTWAPDRASALHRASAALAGYTLLGCGTNVAFLRRLLAHPAVAAGDLSTDLTEQVRPELVPSPEHAVPEEVYAAAALDHQLGLEPEGAGADPFAVPSGWRVGGREWTTWRLRAPGREPVAVDVHRLGPAEPAAAPGAVRRYRVRVDGAEPAEAAAARSADGRTLTVALAGRTERYARAAHGGELWLGSAGAAWSFSDAPSVAPMRGSAAADEGPLRSPMPGTVLAVPVAVGDEVRAGAPIVVVEAMKMEHSVASPIDGTVAHLAVRPGDAVAMDAVLATIAPAGADAPAPAPPGGAGSAAPDQPAPDEPAEEQE